VGVLAYANYHVDRVDTVKYNFFKYSNWDYSNALL